ncbi:MAG: S8 family serine peptidase, partial [Planctomycetota bacterium]
MTESETESVTGADGSSDRSTSSNLVDVGRTGPAPAAKTGDDIERFDRDFEAPSAYPPALAGDAQRHFVYYFDQPRDVILNLESIALLDEGGRAFPTLGDWGLVALDDTRIPIQGWSVATTSDLQRSDDQIEQLVSEMAQAEAGDYIAPVFFDDFGGPLVPSPYIMVGFHDNVAAGQAEAILANVVDGFVERTWEAFPGMYRLRSQSRNGFEVMEAANTLAQLPQVKFASPDMIFTGRADVIPNDTNFDDKWEIHNTGQATTCTGAGTNDADMDGPEAWDLEQGDPSIRVVIIDSGYQFGHPDINHSGFGADFTGEGGGGQPVHACDNHGMAVAGCVSAIINNNLGVVGIAPGCTVASARPFIPTTFNPPCSGNWTSMASWTVDALNWSQTTANARVTNNSNGYGFTDAGIEAAYANTEANGIIHFASAGNSGAGVIGYPASIPEVNAVAALDHNNNLAGFSQFGVGLFISAGGVDILSTDRTGAAGYVGGDYVCIDGTSFSSPTTAGVAALVLSFDPSLTPDEVEAILAKTATDLGTTGYDTTFGWGHVNAEGALLNAGAGTNPVCPSGGNCFESHPYPGCADEECCNTVCAIDPFCCNNTWDGLCANEALELCGPSCGHPNAGDCFVSNGSPYCDNFECCQAVCAIDPFCCNNTWDGLCAGEANDICCPGIVTVNFEDLGVAPGTQLNPAAGVGVVSNGFNYDPGPNNDSGLNDLHISNKEAFWSWNNSTIGGSHDDVVLARVDGNFFELKQFDFAGFPDNAEVPFTVTAQPSGQVVNFTPDGITDGDPDGTGGLVDFQTFTPPAGFIGNSFTWEHYGAGTVAGLFALDNIVTCPAAPTGLVNFFVEEAEFNAVINASGKLLKGDETFEEAVIDDGAVLPMDDPLNTLTDNGIFSPGDILFNLAFQSNLDGPGENGTNPR